MAGETVKACSTCRHNTSRGCAHASRSEGCLYNKDQYDTSMPYWLWEPLEQREDSGADGSYYEVQITHPKSGAPYRAECQDLIEALGMDFNEGNVFKAIWRRCAARTLGKVKAGNEDPLYDAQKIEFYGNRILLKEENK